jgi:hypothetical protein
MLLVQAQGGLGNERPAWPKNEKFLEKMLPNFNRLYLNF